MKRRRSIIFIGALAVMIGIIMIGGLVVVRISPAVGAYGADFLRKIIGNQIVVALETALFKIQDSTRNLEYKLGLSPATSPWAITPVAVFIPSSTPVSRDGSQPMVTPNPTEKTAVAAISPTATEQPAWKPSPVTPLGNLQGVGVWNPYIKDLKGQTVAYRSFVQPDAKRPYALTGIVAFDLEKTRLHFVLGFSEPYASGVKKSGAGKIPAQDLVPERLLAAFNGGFKYEHGAFGAMADGVTSAPPKNGLGTLAIFKDGTLHMGVWGADLNASPDMVAFRQNGPLVIQNGTLNQVVNDPTQWGYTISGGTVTWRSGLAISQDEKTLYYFAGSYLDISSLAEAMQTVNPQTAMQLDINNFWVHFTSFQDENGKIVTQALFPKDMGSDVERFLSPYSRDFFYITTQ